MHANEPAMAKRWEAHTPKDVVLPDHVSPKPKKKRLKMAVDLNLLAAVRAALVKVADAVPQANASGGAGWQGNWYNRGTLPRPNNQVNLLSPAVAPGQNFSSLPGRPMLPALAGSQPAAQASALATNNISNDQVNKASNSLGYAAKRAAGMTGQYSVAGIPSMNKLLSRAVT
jgi:hypothetical protein